MNFKRESNYNIFSFWILLFALLYYVKIISYNPLHLIIISIVFTMEWIYYIKYIKKDMAIVLVYLHIAMFFLVSKNVRLNNIIISITLLNIYLLWLILKNKNPFQIYFENLVTYFNNNDITFLQIIYETFDGFLYL